MERLQTEANPVTRFEQENPSQFISKRLDQLETLGKYSVIYEIARIDTILSQTFVQDLTKRLVNSAV
ncbi:MAG TPA: hypothetical protein V6D17_08140 [Candidatus Obscuribacterales bacterium]